MDGREAECIRRMRKMEGLQDDPVAAAPSMQIALRQ
jgi:hypothetical protein